MKQIQQDSELAQAAHEPGLTSTTAVACRTLPDLSQRPQRIKLRGSVLVLMRLPNQRQVRGSLHQLSLTGGLIHLESTLEEKLAVDLIFHLGETTVREKAELMFPLWATQGWLQPFRFIDLRGSRQQTLQSALLSFIHDSA